MLGLPERVCALAAACSRAVEVPDSQLCVGAEMLVYSGNYK